MYTQVGKHIWVHINYFSVPRGELLPNTNNKLCCLYINVETVYMWCSKNTRTKPINRGYFHSQLIRFTDL